MEEELTHYGQSLAEIEKFEDPEMSDDDDDDDDRRAAGQYIKGMLTLLEKSTWSVLLRHSEKFIYSKKKEFQCI